MMELARQNNSTSRASNPDLHQNFVIMPRFMRPLVSIFCLERTMDRCCADSCASTERGRDPYLFVHATTLDCAVVTKCIPCLYKLFPEGKDDSLLKSLESISSWRIKNRMKFPTNVRPEMCPRTKVHATMEGSSSMYLPSSSYPMQVYGAEHEVSTTMSILTVGDGDFSFSLSLANQLLGDDSVQLTATSHESLKSVLSTYKPHAEGTLANLRKLGATVLHEVDATQLNLTTKLHKPSSKERSKPKMQRYDVVIWNFPCLSLPAGADGQAKELQANRELLTSFFKNVHQFLRKGTGEVHISHKTVEPFSWWGIKQLAKESGFDFAYAVIFDRCNFPGYTNRKALDRKSFPCNDAQTYVFVPTPKNSATSDNTNTDTTESSASALSDVTPTAQRTRLPLLLENNVLVSMNDKAIANKIVSFLIEAYPNTERDEPKQKKQKL